MLSFFARFLFTTTAVAPVFLIYAYALWLENKPLFAGLLFAASMALIGIAAAFLQFCRNRLETKPLEITSVEIADQENIAFLLLYISPLFRSNPTDLNYSIAIPVVALFIVVVMFGNNYHFNPLLNIFGWHFYKVKTRDNVSRVLITRKTIRSIMGKRTSVELSNYVYLEVEDSG